MDDAPSVSTELTVQPVGSLCIQNSAVPSSEGVLGAEERGPTLAWLWGREWLGGRVHSLGVLAVPLTSWVTV